MSFREWEDDDGTASSLSNGHEEDSSLRDQFGQSNTCGLPFSLLNLFLQDPAVHSLPYPVNVDIRSSVKYKEVMKQYNLGV